MMKKLLNRAWTLAMVTVITLLVWLYAEDANVKTYNNERVLIRFVSTGEGEVLIEPEGAVVFANLSGSNGQLQQFRRGIEDSPEILVPVAMRPGESSASVVVDLRKELEEAVLADLGLNLTGLDNETIEVALQEVQPVSLKIRVDIDRPELVRDAEASIQEVTVYLPATAITESLLSTPATLVLTQDALANVQPGVHPGLPLPLNFPSFGSLPPGFDTRPSATEATVTFRRVIERETLMIERLHVKLVGPASLGNRYVVQIPAEHQFLSQLEVAGSPSQIALLRENLASPNILATVELTNAEADAAAAGDETVTKPVLVLISLPGVELTSEPPRIPIEVRLRDAEAPAP